MKIKHSLVILIHIVYLTNGERIWTNSNLRRLTGNNYTRLENIAKVTHNTERNVPSAGTSQHRLGSFARAEKHEKVDRSEVNNLVNNDDEKGNNSVVQAGTEKESATYNFYPSRREVTGKKKQPVSLLTNERKPEV